jgi:hypothetical protein
MSDGSDDLLIFSVYNLIIFGVPNRAEKPILREF